jgi:response regulator RpfG family c-di-GMP phosphodiesterase
LTAEPSPMTVQDAILQIRRGAGTEFDPSLVETFVRIANESAMSLPALAASSKPALIPET